jgi:SET domain-containing protein
MRDIFIDKRLYVARSPLKGADWGVFASEPIPKGTTIEVARTLKVKNKNLFQDDNMLNDYVFKLNDKYSLLALGFGSLFNHHDDPHVNYNVTDGKVYYESVKDILPDEEIFISYGENWWKTRDMKPVK